VIVSRVTGTFFARLLGFASLTPGARAVAGISSSDDCLVALGPGAATISIGNTTLNLPGCNVSAGGGLQAANPNATISGTPPPDVAVSGTCWDRVSACDQMGNLSENTTPPVDPLAGLPAPTDPGGCISVTNPTMPLTAGCYTLIKVDTSVIFGPGIYYMKGPLWFTNNVTATYTGGPALGVMFYFAGTAPTGDCVDSPPSTAGCIHIENSTSLTLKGLTKLQTGCDAGIPGCTTGILFFQDPADHLTASFDGNGGTYNTLGAFYFPGADIVFRNGLAFTNNCALIVARTLTIVNGNGTLSNAGCDAAFGGSPLSTISLAE
jgi:hypothetical protein